MLQGITGYTQAHHHQQRPNYGPKVRPLTLEFKGGFGQAFDVGVGLFYIVMARTISYSNSSLGDHNTDIELPA